MTVAASVVAEGIDGTVRISDDKVVVQRKALGGFLRQAAAIYKDGPGVLTAALEGPNRQVLLEALGENRALARVLFLALREGSPDEEEYTPPSGQSLVIALRRNRDAVIRALRENDDLVKEWLKDHKELFGIFLKGDVHVFRADIESAGLTPARSGEGVLVLTIDGSAVKVQFQSRNEPAFEALMVVLNPGGAGHDEEMVAATPAGTKTCPMCAEDVKAAAKICRFCGHTLEGAPLAVADQSA